MKKLLGEPLLHFLVIGIGLFLLHGLISETEPRGSDQQIVVSAGRIAQLATVFERTWQRPPKEQELKAIIDDFVLEEVYYRRAVAMGIDRDDTIIRRRLRQKLEFLSDDAAALVQPSDEELAAYLAENEDKFRESTKYTFSQVYFNPEKHGDDPENEVARQIDALRSGQAIVGDSSLLPEFFDQASRDAIDGTFGIGFAQNLDKLSVGQWQGPVRSGLGLHLIRLKTRTEGQLPELPAIRGLLLREWDNEQRIANRRKMNERLLEDYEVVIEWPEQEQASETSDEGESP